MKSKITTFCISFLLITSCTKYKDVNKELEIKSASFVSNFDLEDNKTVEILSVNSLSQLSSIINNSFYNGSPDKCNCAPIYELDVNTKENSTITFQISEHENEYQFWSEYKMYEVNKTKFKKFLEVNNIE